MRIIKNALIGTLTFLGVAFLFLSYMNYRAYKLDQTTEVKSYIPPKDSEKINVAISKIEAALPEKTPELIILTPQNSAVFRTVVTEQSVSKLQTDLLNKSIAYPNSKSFYLVLNTPGGSVIAGKQLIDSLQGIPQKVKTVSIFSASMGFQIAQNLDDRLIVPSGVLMSHRASGSFEGEFGADGKGKMLTELNWILNIVKSLDMTASARMKMKFDDYETLIRDEYWTTGKDAVKDNAADRVVILRCNKELLDQVDTETIDSLFGSATLRFSKCPLITYPLDIKMDLKQEITSKQKDEFKTYMDELLKDKKSFVKDYIVNDRYKQVIK